MAHRETYSLSKEQYRVQKSILLKSQLNCLECSLALVRKLEILYWIGMLVGIGGASTDFFPMFHLPIFPIGNIFVCFFPLLIAYAIVRYRLMEIDTVAHKTLLWILTLLVIILPVGVAVTLSFERISTLDRIFKLTFASGVLIFFVWYYGKLKPRVDHFFRRKKYDYYQILGEIGQKIGSELDIGRVAGRLFKEIKDVLYIRNGLILVQEPGQPDYIEIGSIGYESLVETVKEEKTVLIYQSSLAQWINLYQRAVERGQVEVDPKYTPIKEEALNFFDKNALEVLIPVIMENKVNAVLGIGKKESLQVFTIKDVELLESMGRQIGITIDNALHHEDIVEKERLAEEMKLGREIQIALLPQTLPIINGLNVQGLMQPAKEIGGDYYDFITLPDKDKLSVVIGDVSGKGVAAGLLMAMAKTAIHTLSQDESSPKKILLRTNQILNQHIGGQKFMTLLYLMWQAKTRTLTYSSAGHEHILVYRTATGVVEAIMSGGFMLGMVADIDKFLEEKEILLQPHDKVLLYTDGVTEAHNQAQDQFGLERLKDAFKRHGPENAADLMQSIKEEVYSFMGSYPQYDDITLVVLEAK